MSYGRKLETSEAEQPSSHANQATKTKHQYNLPPAPAAFEATVPESRTVLPDGSPLLHEKELVGVEGFELSTFCSQSKRATRLRYTPISLQQRAGILLTHPALVNRKLPEIQPETGVELRL
jgi:hypothetical protein